LADWQEDRLARGLELFDWRAVEREMAEKKTYTGGCHCGEVRFEVTADLSSVVSCNCSSARSLIWPRTFFAQAKEAGQAAAAVAGLKEIGVLSGIRIERSERGGPGEFEWLEKLSVEELQALADGKLDIATNRQQDPRMN
jgi:hypothetical protein